MYTSSSGLLVFPLPTVSKLRACRMKPCLFCDAGSCDLQLQGRRLWGNPYTYVASEMVV